MADADFDREAGLVAAARAGDPSAFDLLIERHGPALLRHLLRLSGSEADALDLFQDTLVRAHRSLPALRDPLAFRSWLAVIATNVFRKRARKHQDALPRAEDFDLDLAEAPSEIAVESDERAALLREAIAGLPARQREVLSMRLDLGLPFQQIAAALGIREENARANHYQALQALRRRMPDFARKLGGST